MAIGPKNTPGKSRGLRCEPLNDVGTEQKTPHPASSLSHLLPKGEGKDPIAFFLMEKEKNQIAGLPFVYPWPFHFPVTPR